MRHGADSAGPLLTVKGDNRVTTIGQLLRKTKIDELPQLWNVLRNDMSLVGPRPESLKYAEQWARINPLITSIKPGLASPASLLYANEQEVLANYADPEASYVDNILPNKVQIDARFFAETSFAKEVAILTATIKHVLLCGTNEIIKEVSGPGRSCVDPDQPNVSACQSNRHDKESGGPWGDE